MSRRKKEPHLILRRARHDAKGRLTHQATWLIKGGGDQTFTGCGRDAFEAAEFRLHEYNVEKHAANLGDARPANQVIIGDLIAFYVSRKEAKFARMGRARRRERLDELRHLNDFWGGRRVSEINETTSAEYQRGRTPSTVRNELIALRAIVNLGEFKGKLDTGGRRLDYALPAKRKARITFYTRDEVAQLLRAAYRAGNVHIARFILTAVYTGTRSERIERASFVKERPRKRHLLPLCRGGVARVEQVG